MTIEALAGSPRSAADFVSGLCESSFVLETEILEERLHLTCYFRSWDAYAGLPANIAGIQLFNEALVSEISRRGSLSLKTGKLIFHSKNCHIYERQFKLVEDLLKPKTDVGKRMFRAQTG